ncbi:MAG: phosphatidate cytidylyltransferase [Lachnospirales bacterium]
MKVRVITALIGLTILIFIIYYGGWFMYFMASIFGLIGFMEFTKAVNKKIDISSIVTAVFIPITFLVLYMGRHDLLIAVFFGIIIANMICLVVKFEDLSIYNISVNLFSYFYTAFTFAILVYIRSMDSGILYLLPIFISAFMSDTFAYFVGRAIGKRKLSPKLSPNKTVEGSIGGIFMSALVVMFYFTYFHQVFDFKSNELTFVWCLGYFVAGALAAGMSQIGDLFASAIKRKCDIKDFGKLMPGHGGVVDRFDSVFMITPIYLVLYMFLH